MSDDDEAAAAERIRLAYDRIQRIELTAALCMLSWLTVAMVLLWLLR